MTTFEPVDWQARLSERISGYIRRQTARNTERQETKLRRNHGLVQRHARKTARTNRQEQQP